MQNDLAKLAYFDAVAIVGIEALNSDFQVVFRLINQADMGFARL
jgi:hypothetical protein